MYVISASYLVLPNITFSYYGALPAGDLQSPTANLSAEDNQKYDKQPKAGNFAAMMILFNEASVEQFDVVVIGAGAAGLFVRLKRGKQGAECC